MSTSSPLLCLCCCAPSSPMSPNELVPTCSSAAGVGLMLHPHYQTLPGRVQEVEDLLSCHFHLGNCACVVGNIAGVEHLHWGGGGGGKVFDSEANEGKQIYKRRGSLNRNWDPKSKSNGRRTIGGLKNLPIPTDHEIDGELPNRIERRSRGP